MRRKLISSLLLFVLIFSVAAGFGTSKNTNAADTTVYVTFSNAGTLEYAQLPITVTDVDNDGKLTTNDVFILFHTEKCSAGAAGYSVSDSSWMVKFWDVDTTAIFYYVNNASVDTLVTETLVNNSDEITVFIYSDKTGYSDKFTYFDTTKKNVTAGQTVTLTLLGLGYDESWNLVSAPLADATITVNGVATTVKTDAAGKATITLTEAGTAVISATSTTTIVPPVCTVTVAAATPGTGVSSVVIIVILALAVVSLSCAIVVRKRAK